MKKRVAVLVSGGGTNLQALIDAGQGGRLPHAELALVVSSRADAFALRRAQDAGLPSEILARKAYTPEAFDAALLALLRQNNIDVVVLAGFMTILGPTVLRAFAGRILNVHPSLIPAYCGAGFYGLRVHEAVLAAGETETGATVHLVTEVVDGGEILLQQRVAVQPGDTPETLQRRVMEQAEWQILPRALELVCEKMTNGENDET